MFAKISTAATLIVGPILDSAGAEYTGAVIGDLSLSKNGGTLTALAAAATLTHIANGQYTLVLTTGNSDTLGRAQITCNKSTYQMPPVNLDVVPAMVYDSLVLGTDVLHSDVTQLLGTAWLTPAIAGTPDVNTKLAGGTAWGSGAITAASIAADAITAAKIADGAIDAATFAAGAINAAAIAADAITDAKVASDVTIASVTGAVGSVTAAVTLPTIPTAWITADGIATDAIGSAELAASAITEIQSGLSTLDAAAIRAAVGLAAGNLDTQLDALPTNSDLATSQAAADDATLAAIAALNNLSAAQVNAEVLDVLNVDTFAEETGVPAATASLRKKIGWLFMWARNRSTQTSTQRKLYADDATTVVSTEAVADDGTTYEKGEAS